MLLIHCPYCSEERPELEFRQAGEAHIARPSNILEAGDEDFEAFLFLRTNTKGLVYERWRHVHGCGRFFNAVRDSVTDRFFMTYKAGQPKPDPARFARAVAATEPLAAEQPAPVSPAQPKPAAPARAPRKVTPTADEEAKAAVPPADPAASTEPATKPARRARAAAAPDTAPSAVEEQPKRKARTTQMPAPASAGTPAKAAKSGTSAKRETPARAAAPEKPDEAAKPKPAPKRTRTTPVKKGEA